MLTKSFWKQALERAIKTFAQALAAVVVAGVAAGLGLEDVTWVAALSVAGLAAVGSFLTSVISLPAGEPASPSAVRTSTVE